MTKLPNHVKCLDITWIGHADCQHCAFRKNGILSVIDTSIFQKTLKRIIQLRYKKNSMLFVENAPAVELFIVRKGLIKLEETLDDGNRRIIRLLKKGSVVGLETFLDNGQRFDQTAIALLEAEVCRVPYQVMKDILDNDPNFYKAVLQEWHDQLEASRNTVVEFSTGSLRQRVARVLLMLVDEANHNGQLEIEMIHANDIAALIGTTRESVSRNIAEFKRNKFLTKSGPNKMRFDEFALREVAETNNK